MRGETKELEVEIVKGKKVKVIVYMEREPGDDVKIEFIDE